MVSHQLRPSSTLAMIVCRVYCVSCPRPQQLGNVPLGLLLVSPLTEFVSVTRFFSMWKSSYSLLTSIVSITAWLLLLGLSMPVSQLKQPVYLFEVLFLYRPAKQQPRCCRAGRSLGLKSIKKFTWSVLKELGRCFLINLIASRPDKPPKFISAIATRVGDRPMPAWQCTAILVTVCVTVSVVDCSLTNKSSLLYAF